MGYHFWTGCHGGSNVWLILFNLLSWRRRIKLDIISRLDVMKEKNKIGWNDWTIFFALLISMSDHLFIYCLQLWICAVILFSVMFSDYVCSIFLFIFSTLAKGANSQSYHMRLVVLAPLFSIEVGEPFNTLNHFFIMYKSPGCQVIVRTNGCW